jgi:TRAP-type mannitol/chloroaromatic compound transport system permease small subunit
LEDLMPLLLAFSGVVDRVNTFLGRSVEWLILLAILVSAANAVSRKAFSISSNAWLELQWYLFGCAYLVAASYTLNRNEHIRIDIVSNMLSKRARDWIDLFGHVVFLMPFTLVMIWECTPFLLTSIRLGEMSTNAGGLIIWPAKFFIWLGFVLLFFQALSEAIKRFAVIRGLIPDPYASTPSHHVPVE